ncbi:MFS general substrate transporter [Boletus coccyginus]|nr:MFS general substrate transporter [Boletus coccyginus]
MKLPFRKIKDVRPEDGAGSQNASAGASASSPSSGHQLGFWRSLDWKLMLALLFPMMLETLDYRGIPKSNISFTHTSYIGTSYLLAFTVFLPLFASIADIYGRHFGLQLSLLFFLVGSALSTGAVNMPMAAAGLLTIVRTLASDTTSLDENNAQQSMLFLLYSVSFSIGPLIGGYLVETNFRWVFAINLPCTALAMLMCFIFLRNRSRVHGAKGEELQAATLTWTPGLPRTPAATLHTWASKLVLIDWIGTFLFVSGGILVLLALNWGPNDNWKTARVIVNLVLGALLIILSVLWEILLENRSPNGTDASDDVHTQYTAVFHPRPMIPLELFTSYDMWVVQYGSTISGMVVFVMFYFVAIFATVVTGLPASQAGIQLLYFAPGIGGGALLSIRIIKMYRQPIYTIVLGNVIMTIGTGLVAMAMQRNIQSQVNGFMAMVGVGGGLTAGPLVIHARFTKPNHIATTNAMLLFVLPIVRRHHRPRPCFTILNAKVNAYITSQLESLANTLSPSDFDALESLLDSGGLTSLTSLDGLPSAVQSVVRDAFLDGVRWGFLSLVPWLGVGCVVSVFLSRIVDPDKEEGKVGSEEMSEVERVEMEPRTGGGGVEAGSKVSER